MVEMVNNRDRSSLMDGGLSAAFIVAVVVGSYYENRGNQRRSEYAAKVESVMSDVRILSDANRDGSHSPDELHKLCEATDVKVAVSPEALGYRTDDSSYKRRTIQFCVPPEAPAEGIVPIGTIVGPTWRGIADWKPIGEVSMQKLEGLVEGYK